VTREELIETITHLAFYAGWPNAVTALGVAKEVFERQTPVSSRLHQRPRWSHGRSPPA
jgi:hypothetical protein